MNIVSLRKHKSELGIILHESNIDIIGLSETSLGSKVNDSKVSIHGYRIYRNDRDSNGGGVAVHVWENLPELITKTKSDKLELISLKSPKISMQNNYILYVGIDFLLQVLISLHLKI